MNRFLSVIRMSLVLFLVASVLYYFTGKDYLEGDRLHYLGTSNVTESQVVELGTMLPIGGVYGKVSNLEIQENGLVQIDYDFYSYDEVSFLVVAGFSYFDTPIVYTIKQDGAFYLKLLGFITLFVFGWFLINRYNQKAPGVATRKILNIMWHVGHPKYIVKAKEAVGKYQPQVSSDINIKLNEQGILCSRTWKYKKGYLYSIGVGQSCWETKTLLANKNPEDDNHNGIYADRLGVIFITEADFIKDIIGIVSLKGDWCEHADGVLRAERCDIVHLIISEYHRPVANEISAVYGVPVTISDTPINTYLDWLLKDNGLACMIHNSKIIGGSSGNKRESCKER